MELKLDVRGFDEVMGALERSPGVVEGAFRPAVTAALIMLAGEMKVYPPPPPGSGYVRTLTLGRTWSALAPEFVVDGNGFWGRIGNPTPYAPYVQDRERQAGQHRGRWQTDGEVLEWKRGEVEAYFEAAVGRVVRGLEGGG